MIMTNKLRSLSGLKTRKNEKENISLTLSMHPIAIGFYNFIARRQVNKNLVFFPATQKF